ncbi:LLM class F420-dependent oxidoreductase [Ruania alba]|uniref:Probable F420-dependent oxidoreductase, Rv1855c family n=1 Tax=Ruania alba TaxID=648782 RepID=A0A1H5G5A3_9MICO|nr:LLM class F420-dependent oxidoreductase [Ruania alba]SEE10741.1 probable F420-dependent oxidoreductase, Rv1855c family [Ruania alba]
MKFGLFVPQGWRYDLVGISPADQWEAMNGIAQHVDDGPWDSMWVYDHFHTTPVPSAEATHEAWTLMAAFAASTRRIKLGQMCTCMAYRNPAYLAKVAATVDVISGGRVQMGIGGGWYEHEWRAYGYGFPRAGIRLQMLDEGVQIMRQAWTEGIATLDGQHYQVDGAIVQPRPLQDGGIPMWIAGGGEKVTLKIAARYATHTNFDGSPDGFAHKSAVLREHCDAVGTDFGAIVRSSNYNTAIGATEAEVDDRIRTIEDRMTASIGAERTSAIVANYRSSLTTGTPEQVVERLRRMEEAGMTYAICYFPEAAYDRSGLDLFAREVIPELDR